MFQATYYFWSGIAILNIDGYVDSFVDSNVVNHK